MYRNPLHSHYGAHHYRYNPIIPERSDDWKYAPPQGGEGWEISPDRELDIEFLGRNQFERSGLLTCIDILRVTPEGDSPERRSVYECSPDHSQVFKVTWSGRVNFKNSEDMTYTLAGVSVWDDGWNSVFSYSEIEQIDDPMQVLQLAYAICTN